jgi:hypothetical protein
VSDIALDPVTGDIALTAGAARLVTGAAAVAQRWEAQITMFLGEWFLDRSLGIDYQNDVFEKPFRPTVVRALLANETRAVPGIRDVKDLRLALDARARVLRVVAKVVFDDGSTDTLSSTQPIGG